MSPLLKSSLSLLTVFLAGCTGMSQKTSDSTDRAVTVATFNVRTPADREPPFDWKTRAPLIREVLRRNSVDIAGLQEPVDHQLKAILEGTDFKSIGGAREDFRSKGEYSCIIYNAKRFDVLESGTFGLSEQPGVPGLRSWGTRWPRIASWGVFLDKKSGKRFMMYNTHLDNRVELARINGIRLIAAHAGKKRERKIPMILTGDFNARPDSETIRIARSLLSDSADLSETGHRGEKDSFHKWGTLPERKHLDYIFISPDVRVLKHWTEDNRVKGIYSSDHDPVMAEIILK